MRSFPYLCDARLFFMFKRVIGMRIFHEKFYLCTMQIELSPSNIEELRRLQRYSAFDIKYHYADGAHSRYSNRSTYEWTGTRGED